MILMDLQEDERYCYQVSSKYPRIFLQTLIQCRLLVQLQFCHMHREIYSSITNKHWQTTSFNIRCSRQKMKKILGGVVKLQIQFLGMSSQALPWHTSLLCMYLKFSIFTLYHYTMGTSVMHTCKQFWSTLFFHIFSRLDSARYLLKLSSFVSAIAWSCYEWKAYLLTILALAGMVEIVFFINVCLFFR